MDKTEFIKTSDSARAIEIGQPMLWITSWPHGLAKLVMVLAPNPNICGGIYISKADGGTDTTTEEFLFDIPSQLKPDPLDLLKLD